MQLQYIDEQTRPIYTLFWNCTTCWMIIDVITIDCVKLWMTFLWPYLSDFSVNSWDEMSVSFRWHVCKLSMTCLWAFDDINWSGLLREILLRSCDLPMMICKLSMTILCEVIPGHMFWLECISSCDSALWIGRYYYIYIKTDNKATILN